MCRLRWPGLACLVFAVAMTPAAGDEFERIEGPALAAVARSKDACERRALTFAELDALPAVLRDSRSALVIATTDQGNRARMLVAPALRKTPGGKPIPVIVLERFDTFEPGRQGARPAHGKDVILFDGFQFDLDSGQVVPEGQGGDVQFLTSGKEGSRLAAVGKATLYTLTKAPFSAPEGSRRPSIGRSVVPADFAGRYRLFANGQWSGTLDLKVDTAGTVTGSFRSDLNGSVYPVNGQVAADVPQKVTFTIKYPRTRQDFEGLLWTEGKGALAGTLVMLDRAYGFFALREGARFAPEGDDVGPLARENDRPGRRSVTLRKGLYTLDGKPKTDQELTDALKTAVAAEPRTWVLLQIPSDEPFSGINQAFETIGAAGVASVRLAPADPAP